jgi:hypothetical protein
MNKSKPFGSGFEAFEDFKNCCLPYLKLSSSNQRVKKGIANSLLTGLAFNLSKRLLMDDLGSNTPIIFKPCWSMIRKRFKDPSVSTTKPNKLKQFYMMDSLTNYVANFYDLSNKCGWLEIAVWQQFCSQLKPWLHQKYIGFEENSLQELVTWTLWIDQQSQLCKPQKTYRNNNSFQLKRDEKDWRDQSQQAPICRYCTFGKNEGHTQDFCYLRKVTNLAKFSKPEVKVIELYLPHTEERSSSNQDE